MRRGFWQGAVAAIAVAAITWALPATMQLPWLRGLLWLTVGIYLGMAWMDSQKALRTEILGGLPIAALALASVQWPWLLVVGWGIHPIWDLLHWKAIKTRIHPVIVPFCLVFDLLVAGVAAFVIT